MTWWKAFDVLGYYEPWSITEQPLVYSDFHSSPVPSPRPVRATLPPETKTDSTPGLDREETKVEVEVGMEVAVDTLSDNLFQPSATLWNEVRTKKHTSAQEREYCQRIDQIKKDIRQLAQSGRARFTLRGLPPDRVWPAPVVHCNGLDIGRVGLRSRTPEEISEEPAQYGSKGLLHVFISPQEKKSVKHLFQDLPFVSTDQQMDPADIVFTINDRPLYILERKHDYELLGANHGRFAEQRKALTHIDLPRSSISILHEKGPGTEARTPAERAIIDATIANTIHRDGLGWRTTSCLLHTVLVILQDILSLLRNGSWAWQTGSSSAATSDYTPRLPRVSGRPAKNINASNIVSSFLRALPGLGEHVCRAVERVYPTFPALMTAFRDVSEPGLRPFLLQDIPWSASAHHESDGLAKRKQTIGPKRSSLIYCALFGLALDHPFVPPSKTKPRSKAKAKAKAPTPALDPPKFKSKPKPKPKPQPPISSSPTQSTSNQVLLTPSMPPSKKRKIVW